MLRDVVTDPTRLAAHSRLHSILCMNPHLLRAPSCTAKHQGLTWDLHSIQERIGGLSHMLANVSPCRRTEIHLVAQDYAHAGHIHAIQLAAGTGRPDGPLICLQVSCHFCNISWGRSSKCTPACHQRYKSMDLTSALLRCREALPAHHMDAVKPLSRSLLSNARVPDFSDAIALSTKDNSKASRANRQAPYAGTSFPLILRSSLLDVPKHCNGSPLPFILTLNACQ